MHVSFYFSNTQTMCKVFTKMSKNTEITHKNFAKFFNYGVHVHSNYKGLMII